MLSPANLALARSHTYVLLAELYLLGITADWLPTLQNIPSLAPHVLTDLDQAAAEHQALFTFHLFPYESFFLDATGLLGGPVTDKVLHSYRQGGYWLADSNTSPDHLGHELGFMAFLCAAEAEAWEDGATAVAHQIQQRCAHFLQTHLLRWLPPLLAAIYRHAFPFYTALARLTAEFVIHHCHNLTFTFNELFQLPTPPVLLEGEKSRLPDIAHYLLTPPFSGLFLSRAEISQLAHQLKLPRGFGSRQDMLLNLFQIAGQYEGVPALLQQLRQLVLPWQQAYEELTEQGLETAVWQQRLNQTTQLLQKMSQQME